VAFGCGVGGNEESRLVPFGFAQGCGCAPAFGRAVGPKARRVMAPKAKALGYQPCPFDGVGGVVRSVVGI
jgi:hypothetical protein